MNEDEDNVAETRLTYQIAPIPRRCHSFECEERPTHAVVSASGLIPEAPVVPGVWFFCNAHAHPHLVAELLPGYVDLDAWRDEASQELFEGHDGDNPEATT